MPWKILIPLWLVLLACTVGLWSRRFEQVQHLPGWNLLDLRENSRDLPGLEWRGEGGSAVLRVWRGPGGLPNSVVVPLPGAVGVEGLHVRHRFRASGLLPGRRPWEDGRVMVEWHRPDGVGEPEHEYLASVRHGQEVMHPGVVMRPLEGPAVPMLRFEHLGQAGSYDIQELSIRPVRERPQWLWGRWVLAGLWCGWCYGLIARGFGVQGWRAGVGAGVWVVCAALLALPGPWKIQRPLGLPFAIGVTQRQGERVGEVNPPVVMPVEGALGSLAPALDRSLPGGAADGGGASSPDERSAGDSVHRGKVAPAVGKVPVRGSLSLRIREWTRGVRPLLHAWMMAAPAVVFAGLLGTRAAWWLALALALASEWAQYGYGYGFGPDDLVDLGFDALGVWCGILVWRWLATWMRRFNPVAGAAK